jgi:hypothetical protein
LRLSSSWRLLPWFGVVVLEDPILGPVRGRRYFTFSTESGTSLARTPGFERGRFAGVVS